MQAQLHLLQYKSVCYRICPAFAKQNLHYPLDFLAEKRYTYQVEMTWACSSVGRAFGSHPRGQGFESLQVHKNRKSCRVPAGLFAFKLTWRGLEQGDGAAVPGPTVQWTVGQPAGKSRHSRPLSFTRTLAAIIRPSAAFLFNEMMEKYREES